MSAKETLSQLGRGVEEQFSASRRVLAFSEYLELVEVAPSQQLRNTAQYLLDLFDHYGQYEVEGPCGKLPRFRLFDAPFEDGEDRLIGQERVQNKLYRLLRTFVRQRRIDRFVLLHGPNGSSKSTVTDMLARAMEHYSSLDEGALYQFNWIFPTRGVERQDIGFGHAPAAFASANDTFARLDDAEIDARIPCDLRDHPILLIPQGQRADLFAQWKVESGGFLLSDYLRAGDLCHKCKKIYEALLRAYQGDYLKVMRHIQVERYYVSRRYRISTSRVEPQLAVDARSRQLTADRSLGSLPASLQSLSLYSSEGELVDANRGILDYSDLLKRPPEAYKYLLGLVEGGSVGLDAANLFLDLLFIGSANENHLNAFMESPEWTSFKARIELIRVPYLLDYRRESEIYRQHLPANEVGKPLAPHAIDVASLWAVLSRLHRPSLGLYKGRLKELVALLKPRDKAELYAYGKAPAGTTEDDARLLRASVADIHAETDAALVYEGRTGASPREIRSLLLNAAQDDTHASLTADAVLRQIDKLTHESSVYEFLRQKPQEGYFDHAGFVSVCRDWYLDQLDDDVRHAAGLVEEASYADLFARYINHVTHYVRREQLLNPVTNKFEDPDPGLMGEVEKALDIGDDSHGFRQNVISKIGAWSIDHPGEKPDYSTIFREYFDKLRAGYYARQRRRLAKLLGSSLRRILGEGESLPAEEVVAADRLFERLTSELGYPEAAAKEAIADLVRHRYS